MRTIQVPSFIERDLRDAVERLEAAQYHRARQSGNAYWRRQMEAQAIRLAVLVRNLLGEEAE